MVIPSSVGLNMRFGPMLLLVVSVQLGAASRHIVSWNHPAADVQSTAKTSSSGRRLVLRNSSNSTRAAAPVVVGAETVQPPSGYVKALPSLGSARETLASKAQSQRNASQAAGPGMIHFLFMANDKLPHGDIWNTFFSRAAPNTFSAMIHCKDPEGCKRNGVFAQNPRLQMVPTTPTYYCHDLVTAMQVLLVEALKINAASGGALPEKFVFVSDSTLPAKPFNLVHSTLVSDDDSDFCVFPSDQWAFANIDGHNVQLVKHHQWVVLNRAHAELFVRQWVPVDARAVWHIWLRGGSWAGKERFLSPQHFSRPPHANTCTDEWAFIATIFGAIEPQLGVRQLPGFGGGFLHMSGPASLVQQGRCRTFAYWDKYDTPSEILASQISADSWASRISCYPKCISNPATIEAASDNSLRAIRSSPFLFVRKFSNFMSMPNFSLDILDF